MKLQEFYELAIRAGIDAESRSQAAVENELLGARQSYENLKSEEKATFDIENFTNPYADSRILYGDPDRDVQKILVGIDIETPELFLADQLTIGAGIGLMLAHYPEGRACANFCENAGRHPAPFRCAEQRRREPARQQMEDVERSLPPVNHTQPVDAARLLDIPFLCLHTPADNMVLSCLQALLASFASSSQASYRVIRSA